MACPLWPFHLLIVYVMTLCPIWLLFTGAAAAAKDALWDGTFSPDEVKKIVEGTDRMVYYWSNRPLTPDFKDGTIEILVSAENIASVVHTSNGSSVTVMNSHDGKPIAAATVPNRPTVIYLNTSEELTTQPLNLSFVLRGHFLGYTQVRVRASANSPSKFLESDALSVSVVRMARMVDDVFIYSVAVLMALNYINMGSSLDLDVVKNTLKRPIGPAVGIFCQYVFMPLIAFGLAYAVFEEPALRLGLFTSGCSPGGGASNMWTYLLDGNLNLSITMTFFSNLFAFAMMPFWLFTLGRIIFQDSNIKIPYTNIISYVVVLVIPVGVGVLLQVYLPRVARICRRILGPFSVAMILFIVVFGIYTNLFMFEVVTWQFFMAGLCVPLFGYAFGAIAARLLRFPVPDITAVAIETGVQNTGIAIVLLRLTLPQPEADLTSVVPVALATMTPIPLVIALIIQKIRKRAKEGRKNYTLAGTSSPTSSDEETATLNRKENGLPTDRKLPINENHLDNGRY